MYVSGWLTIILLSALLYKRDISFTVLDCILFACSGYEFINFFFSINKIAGYEYLVKSVIVFCYYLIIRLTVNTDIALKRFLRLSVGIIFFLSAITIFSFLLFKETFINADFDLYDVKSFYHPMGMLNNVWSTIMINLLGFPILCIYYFRTKKYVRMFASITVIQVIFCIIISFSRGAYLSLIAFSLLMAYYFFSRFSKKLKYCLYAFFLAFIIILWVSPYQNDIFKTLSINETVSQKRSTESRIEMGITSLDILKKNPFTGVGSGNFSQAANNYIFEDDNNNFTSFCGNSIFQLISEKGLCGTFLYLALCIWVLYLLTGKKVIRKEFYILLCVLIAFLVRETTFSTFFESTGLQMTVVTYIAISQNLYLNKAPSYKPPDFKYTFLLPGLIWLLLSIFNHLHVMNEKNNSLFLQKINSLEMDDAKTYIERTNELTPYLINRSLLYWELFKIKDDKNYLFASKQYLLKAIKKNNQDQLLLYNLSLIFVAENKPDSALLILKKLTEEHPNNSLYQLGLSKQLYSMGKSEIASTSLKKAILMNPNILNTTFFQTLSSVDSVFCAKISAYFEQENLPDDKNPIQLAKAGKISFFTGDTIAAERYLRKALSILPNLPEPWFLLGYIEKSKGNKSRDYFQKAIVLDKFDSIYLKTYNSDTIQKIPLYDETKISERYIPKFHRWYKSKTSKKRIIFSEE
jgi:tetratricopeptide (TPR) repeat protein